MFRYVIGSYWLIEILKMVFWKVLFLKLNGLLLSLVKMENMRISIIGIVKKIKFVRIKMVIFLVSDIFFFILVWLLFFFINLKSWMYNGRFVRYSNIINIREVRRISEEFDLNFLL